MWNMLQSCLGAEWFQTEWSVVFASSDTDTAIMRHPEALLQASSKVVGCLNGFCIYKPDMFFFGFYFVVKVAVTQDAWL